MDATKSLKQQTLELRRSHILAAAISVFAERGFHRATIRDVAIRAGVSDGTIYNAFPGKDALLMAALDPLDEISGVIALQNLPPPDTKDFLVGDLKRRFEALTPERLDLHRVILSEALINPELRTLYFERVLKPTFTAPETTFATLMEAGAIRSDDPAFSLRAITAIVLGIVMLRLLGDQGTAQRWERLPGLLSSLLRDGLISAAEESTANDLV